MRKLFFFLMLAASYQVSFAQVVGNLVPNGDFESKAGCPDYKGGCSLCPGSGHDCPAFEATGWDRLDNHGGTADYFNACAVNSDVGVPDNVDGHQPARSGDGYAGFASVGSRAEYFNIQLSTTLAPGRKYKAGMYVAMSLGPNNGNSPRAGVGMLFTANEATGTVGCNNDNEILSQQPQVISTVAIPFDASHGWTEVTGNDITSTTTFDGAGTQWLTIGIFQAALPSTYYYVDDVYVIDCDVRITPTVTPALCSNDGAILLDITGGNPTYTYQWTATGNPNYSSDQNISNLNIGSYSVTVTDANGCSASATINVPGNLAMSLTFNVTNTSCSNNNGSIDLSVSGGQAPYTYYWAASGSSSLPTTQDITTLTANHYCVTVTDANGCMKSSCADVYNQSLEITTLTPTNVTCKGYKNGTLTAAIQGGVPPYTTQLDNDPYINSTNPTSTTYSNLTPGLHCISVQDAAVPVCKTTQCVTITEPDYLIATLTPHNDCFGGGCNGSVTSSVTGGTPPYSYQWYVSILGLPIILSGQTSPDLTGLCPGTYILSVTDANGCPNVKSKTITTGKQIVVPPIATAANCANIAQPCNGSASVQAPTSGDGPFIYTWLRGTPVTTSVPPYVSAVTGLCPGPGSLTVTDVNGCTASFGFWIPAAAPLITSAIGFPVHCKGGNDGQALATVLIGIPPYTYAWSNGQTTQTATNLVAGNYDVTITDANGCTADNHVTVTEPATGLAVTLSPTNPLCPGGNGSITANVVGGTGIYTYAWTDGQVTQTAVNLRAGVYCVTVTDNPLYGCTVTACTTIVQPLTGLSLSLSSTPVNCNARCDGSITATVAGANGPFIYTIRVGALSIITLPTASPYTRGSFCAGTYPVSVTDVGSGCTATGTVVVGRLSTPLIRAINTTPSDPCNTGGPCSGSAGIVLINYSNAPYTYRWSNNSTGSIVTGLCNGTYQVTVTSADGCNTTATVNINPPAPLVVTTFGTGNLRCYGNNNGSVTATIIGGTPPYNTMWSNAMQNVASITGLTAGTYCVSVTDKNQCAPVSSCFTINQPSQITITFTNTPVTCPGGNDGSLTAHVSGGTPWGVSGYFYTWNVPSQSPFGGYGKTITGLLGGTNYCVTVTDRRLCAVAACTTVPGPPSFNGSFAAFNDCNGPCTAGYTLTYNAGYTPPITYTVIPGNYTGTFTTPGQYTVSGLCTGSYTLNIVDVLQCMEVFNLPAIPSCKNSPDNTAAKAGEFDIYPNPFSDNTTIEFVLTETEPVTLYITDMAGKELLKLVKNATYEAGIYRFNIDASLAEGVYFCVLKSGDTIKLKKLVKIAH